MKKEILIMLMILFVNQNFSNTLKMEYFIYKDKKIEYLYNKSINKNDLCKLFIKSTKNEINFYNYFNKCIKQKKIKNTDIFTLVISDDYKGQEEDIVTKFIIHIQQKYKLIDKKIDVFSNADFFKLYNEEQKRINELKKNHIKKRRELALAQKKETDSNKLKIIKAEIKELKIIQTKNLDNLNSINSLTIVKNETSFCDFL
ncbi:hypothetical protein [Flavobacterium macrobrachii]|uniref:Uncharacterized protein n=1 Tax=Flavobacterium macrobrachii TaxID=591204 RepID=A0ABS2CUZ7_9FLAO|nr:hypothetical protein [Flavobacterium macrobrachii]MBM6497980.1 hypothetical protein [Flavobacterium macrobrachii]